MAAWGLLNAENEDPVAGRAKDVLVQEFGPGTRKAFRSVNRHKEHSENISEPLKFQRTTSSPQKASEETATTKTSVPVWDDVYPEIENFFPYDPLDCESFELPEEHRIAHLPLGGMPLMFFEEKEKSFGELSASPFIFGEQRDFGKLPYEDSPTPPKMFIPLWTSDVLESPSLSSELAVELPSPVSYDSDSSIS
ncbi:securin [Sorex araneus]|uniref:securin n=1 Tax=Sorex araneus TaxID=42254 RepID=UPI002433E676|nr:securin [Sorex araneus]